MDTPTPSLNTFDCYVELPGWRLHLAQMTVSQTRELGNVMDVAIQGALNHVLRSHSSGRLEESAAIKELRESLSRMGLDPAATPPSSELMLAEILANGEVPRGSIGWEFLAVLTAKSEAPWSALCRDALNPPLVLRQGRAGERITTQHGEFDCAALPVLADQDGIKGSPWTPGTTAELEGCLDPVFVCYLPEELFRKIDPKSHLGRVAWLTWACRFVFERTCRYRGEGDSAVHPE